MKRAFDGPLILIVFLAVAVIGFVIKDHSALRKPVEAPAYVAGSGLQPANTAGAGSDRPVPGETPQASATPIKPCHKRSRLFAKHDLETVLRSKVQNDPFFGVGPCVMENAEYEARKEAGR